MMRSVMIYVVW